MSFVGAKWLLVDSNVKPDKTLVTVKNIVNHKYSEFAGLLITLKIGDYESANLIDRWTEIDRGLETEGHSGPTAGPKQMRGLFRGDDVGLGDLTRLQRVSRSNTRFVEPN